MRTPSAARGTTLQRCRRSTPKVRDMDAKRLNGFVRQIWDDAVIPSLVEYIRIPNKSPSFDKDWLAHGYMDAAVRLMESWARKQLQRIEDATVDVVRLEGRTPVIFIEIPGEGDEPVLLY